MFPVAIIAVIAQLPLLGRAFVELDEGHLLYTSEQIRSGGLLYRDLHSSLSPGIYLVTAGLFELFGTDLLVTRWAQIVVNALTATYLWFLATRTGARRWAVLAPSLFILTVVLTFPALSILNYSTVAQLLALCSLTLLTLRTSPRGTSRRDLAVGSVVGLTVLFKQNYGALAAAGIALAIAWHHRHRLRSTVPRIVRMACGGAGVLAMAVGWLAASGNLSAAIVNAALDPIAKYGARYAKPLPLLFGELPGENGVSAFLYMPPRLFEYAIRGETLLGVAMEGERQRAAIHVFYGFPILVLTIAPILLALSRHRVPPAQRDNAAMVSIFAAVFFLGVFPNPDSAHLSFVLAPVLCLSAIAGARLDLLLSRRPVMRGCLIVSVAALSALFAVAGAVAVRDIRRWNATPMDLRGVSLLVTDDQARLYDRAIDFIDSCAGPGESIFAISGVPALYTMAGRPNATRYDLFMPGAVDEEEVVRQLEPVRCVVREEASLALFAPLAGLYPTVDAYLNTNFRTAVRIRGEQREWLGLERREEDRSSPAAIRPTGRVAER